MPTTTGKTALFHRDLNYDYPVIVRGDGIYMYDDAGKRFIDGGAGAGNVTLGHGRERIVNAMAEQAKSLAYCFSAYFTNAPALELAERVTALAPGDLNHVYFVSGGSEGVETAIKIARQYNVQRGKPQKQKVIARWRSYHGATIGALACTGMPGMRSHFAPWLAEFPHIAPCHPYRCEFAGCDGKCNLSCADDLERQILQVGPENVAAFIGEPIVQGTLASGVPPQEYFPRIREICDKYDVLFIADEVITGFGRTGKYFAIEHWNVVPDIIVFAKAISSGYAPLGGVLFTEEIRDSFAESGQQFAHVFTYVNNPVATRAGLEVLDILEEESILAHAAETGAYLGARADELHSHASVGEVRNKGMTLGIEFVRDKATREPFPVEAEFHKRLATKMLARGLSTACTGGVADWKRGDDLRLNPPLIATKEQVDEMIGIIDEAVTEVEKEV